MKYLSLIFKSITNGPIPLGCIRFAAVSTKWTNPVGTYPLCGPIHEVDESRWDISALDAVLRLSFSQILPSTKNISISPLFFAIIFPLCVQVNLSFTSSYVVSLIFTLPTSPDDSILDAVFTVSPHMS